MERIQARRLARRRCLWAWKREERGGWWGGGGGELGMGGGERGGGLSSLSLAREEEIRKEGIKR